MGGDKPEARPPPLVSPPLQELRTPFKEMADAESPTSPPDSHRRRFSSAGIGGILTEGALDALESSTDGQESSKFTFFVAVCFTINYVMGTGFLTLPYAFAQCGAVLGLLCLGLTAFLSNISKDYLIEVMARAEFISDPKNSPQKEGLIQPASPRPTDHLLRDVSHLTVRDRKFELPALCELFLGWRGKISYLICLCLYVYGSNSCLETLPIKSLSDNTTYLIYLVLFAAVVCPLACLELHEQIGVQVTLSACRFLMVILMVSSTAVAYNSDQALFPSQVGAEGLKLFDISKLYVFLPISTYAFIYHHSIPGLSEPVHDKKQLGNIFLCTFVVCSAFYGSIGLIVSCFFGSHTSRQANLDWKGFSGFGGGGFAKAVSLYVLLFPALDVASAFPLIAITLGNNMMAAYFGDDVFRAEKCRRTRVLFRLMACVPPIIGAVFVSQLDTITSFTGTVGIIITFIFPALLQLSSRRMLKDLLQIDTARVFYSNYWSRKFFVPIVLLITTAIFFFTLISLIMQKAGALPE